jgi:hypothetical protein
MREQALMAMLTAASLPFLTCLVLGWVGWRRAAWATCGAVVLFALAVPVWIDARDTTGDAGLGALFIVILFLMPAILGALLGAGLGHFLGRDR